MTHNIIALIKGKFSKKRINELTMINELTLLKMISKGYFKKFA